MTKQYKETRLTPGALPPARRPDDGPHPVPRRLLLPHWHISTPVLPLPRWDIHPQHVLLLSGTNSVLNLFLFIIFHCFIRLCNWLIHLNHHVFFKIVSMNIFKKIIKNQRLCHFGMNTLILIFDFLSALGPFYPFYLQHNTSGSGCITKSSLIY